MPCEEYESRIVACVLGELAGDEAAGVAAHIEVCERCRDTYDAYTCLVDSMAQESEPCPTALECEALGRALAHVGPVGQRAQTASDQLPPGLPALIWGSFAAFVLVATVLAMQVFGVLDLAGAVWTLGPAPVALAVVLTIFLTSFVPIAVTARRRPLNGMTFRG